MKASINSRSSLFSLAMRFIFSCWLYGGSICINSLPKLAAGSACSNGGSYNYLENLISCLGKNLQCINNCRT
ncbi:MAG TPA: hypothetical protein VGE90_10465 [Chitinophaga sp.]